ncbi:hypothetical protein BKA65DRAFT_510022 [Rhexocercosporidium sp. MPI-PUGE-AT-0058]|nr:hypothetical protein BKA65DRAFT_510022 [Rhexocercosporidium sp. MPI-PUGE-AT-0058]
MLRLFSIPSFRALRMASNDMTLTTSQRALIPESKIDTEAVERLEPLDSPTLAPLIPHLLIWIQDANWPVAWPVIQLLQKHPAIVVEPVRKVLRDEAGEVDDGSWKSNCLSALVAEMDKEYQIQLKEEILRMARSPTKEELEWETMDIAKDILEELGITVESSPKPSPGDLESESK